MSARLVTGCLTARSSNQPLRVHSKRRRIAMPTYTHKPRRFGFGLIKNHPWHGGNKRTATFLTDRFLRLNGWRIVAMAAEFIEMVLAVEADKWTVEQVAEWMRRHIRELT